VYDSLIVSDNNITNTDGMHRSDKASPHTRNSAIEKHYINKLNFSGTIIAANNNPVHFYIFRKSVSTDVVIPNSPLNNTPPPPSPRDETAATRLLINKQQK
jgi:hypothetical protein